MKFRELSPFLESTFDYPVSSDAVVDSVGDVAVEAPDASDAETIETVLSRLGPATYRSADGLYNSIRGNVSDEYIGRKSYDDRGSNPTESWTSPPDRERSF